MLWILHILQVELLSTNKSRSGACLMEASQTEATEIQTCDLLFPNL